MKFLPSWKNALLSLLAAGLLTLAFPDFEWWWMAWFALVPLMWAVEREGSVGRSFLLGWLFGTAFFFGTCWWLTYAPIHYAAMPWPVAYLLILIACIGAGVFPGIFAGILSHLLRRFGYWAFLAAPFVWVLTEFLRYWLTGNNWNAVGYSQFETRAGLGAAIGGVLYVTGIVAMANSYLIFLLRYQMLVKIEREFRLATALVLLAIAGSMSLPVLHYEQTRPPKDGPVSRIIALQPNVPMSGLNFDKWQQLRQRQFDVAESEINKLTTDHRLPTTVILPESPMNFMYNDDREFQQYVRDFTTRNNVSLLFNSAEPDPTNGKYFNSAVMIGADGKMAAQYDKIYLLPFGEAVPVPFESVMPAFVGNFSYGREYDLLPFGDAAGGIMICFESHFGQLSREYVSRGADVLIEMTNDGYLGPTPILRQHLANAVFRAVETNRPVLRVTNVGITAYITERGEVLDPAPVYQEDTRVWTVSRSDGSQTFYVRYGDWFAWLCTIVTLGLLIFGIATGRKSPLATGG
ncbi:MAG: apolipoprotein N-acyltransferase [Acidobacteriota bacterium]|nr:MAG: apolipoprotein N-acyltransferase [Acidobacteriota bacterium]